MKPIKNEVKESQTASIDGTTQGGFTVAMLVEELQLQPDPLRIFRMHDILHRGVPAVRVPFFPGGTFVGARIWTAIDRAEWEEPVHPNDTILGHEFMDWVRERVSSLGGFQLIDRIRRDGPVVPWDYDGLRRSQDEQR